MFKSNSYLSSFQTAQGPSQSPSPIDFTDTINLCLLTWKMGVTNNA